MSQVAASAKRDLRDARLNVVEPRSEERPRRHFDGRCPRLTQSQRIPPAEVPEVELYHPKSWWTKYVFSQDAKVIAIQYSLTAIGDRAGGAGAVLADAAATRLSRHLRLHRRRSTIYQFITMHGMIMVIYLLTALFLGGFGNYLIPLMVGARDMVFPYVNMLSYWIYLLAVLVLVASFFVPGGPTGAGWTLYPPQAILAGTPGQEWGIILMLVSLILFIIGFTMGGLNYVVTVLQARTRGMTLMRMPLTVWGIFTATVMALLAFPALFVACVMMLFDRLLGTSFFMPALVEMGEQLKYGGGSPILFQHLFWFFGHPEVYIVALPAFGIVSDLISTHARKNIFGYRMMVWAIVGIGALSFVVWAHHMYVSGMHPYFGFFFATTTLIIAIPTAIKVYNWVLTLWRGDIHLTVPMLFALGLHRHLREWRADRPLPRQRRRRRAALRHHVRRRAFPHGDGRGADHGRSSARSITGIPRSPAGCWMRRWASSISGSRSSAPTLIFFPMHYLGLLGVPRRYHELGDTAFIPASAMTLNAFITVAALIVGFAQMVFLFNLVWSLSRAGRPAAIRGGRPRWNGRRRRPRRGTATGARSCRSSIAGPMTTACRAPRRTSFRRTSRRPTRAVREPRRERHRPVHGCDRGHRRMVALAAAADGEALAGGRLDRRLPGHGSDRPAGSEDRARRVPRGRRLAVRAVHQRLLHAHGTWRTGGRCRCRGCCGSTPACWS